MSHYICTGGCEGVSETSGVCQDKACPLHQHPLVKCDCVDGKHKEAYERIAKEKDEEKRSGKFSV